MVVNPQILGYSMIMHQIIHCFEIDTSWILNLLFKLICWSDWYVEMFYKNMEHKENHGDM